MRRKYLVDGPLYLSGAQGGDVSSGSACLDQLHDGRGSVATVGDDVAAKAQVINRVGP